MKNIAIIDIGSNNIKLEVHQIHSEGHAELLYSEKVAARLGHKVFITHCLAESSIKLAVSGILQFSKIIKNMNCSDVIALGTAALRESNSQPFLDRVKKECGITIRVISGVEEARLVYLGVLANISFGGRSFFLNDIGGGSTEISVSSSDKIYYMESLPLGTVRLKELFEFNQIGRADSEWSRNIIKKYVNKIFKPFHREIKKYTFDMGLCTGGTARNLAEIIKLNTPNNFCEENGLPILETKALREFIEITKNKSIKELEKIKGIDKQRIDIIIPGAILLLCMCEVLKIKKSLVLTKGLRDGALADFIHKKVGCSTYNSRQDISKKMSLQKISDKYNLEKQHAQQCALLAVRLFDLLNDEHKLDAYYKDILFGGALLHDIGSYISYHNHHKHSEYLIMNSELLNFSSKEKHWISLIARYHKKGFPKDSHVNYQSLKPKEKDIILKLSALVRIADSLDRSYQSLIQDISLNKISQKKIYLGIKGSGDLSLELWSANRKKKYFEKVFKKSLEITLI